MIFIKSGWPYINGMLAYIADFMSKLPFGGRMSLFSESSCLYDELYYHILEIKCMLYIDKGARIISLTITFIHNSFVCCHV
jgi:hypothetical protein